MKKLIFGVLVLANAMVLLGQLWPEGAPPAARTVNIATLVVNVLVFVLLMRGGAPKKK